MTRYSNCSECKYLRTDEDGDYACSRGGRATLSDSCVKDVPSWCVFSKQTKVNGKARSSRYETDED